ncbi:hypothetical protein EW146_g4599 [Bondarzewia mesenterica]|uniref:Uncharacterized protein n=1 Tax=Bondarzewia mesenterica TaxID=1095465 RepID=A0A4S4LW84_9AGAM|nr:hypothetical protein EW146_g4599 [Bondarzewia mesenterica]
MNTAVGDNQSEDTSAIVQNEIVNDPVYTWPTDIPHTNSVVSCVFLPCLEESQLMHIDVQPTNPAQNSTRPALSPTQPSASSDYYDQASVEEERWMIRRQKSLDRIKEKRERRRGIGAGLDTSPDWNASGSSDESRRYEENESDASNFYRHEDQGEAERKGQGMEDRRVKEKCDSEVLPFGLGGGYPVRDEVTVGSH